MEKKYPIGGYAPGNYHNRCYTCERSFFGDKRAIQCEECAVNDLRERLKPYEPATPQGIGWVKAVTRLPGWSQLAKWRYAGTEPYRTATMRTMLNTTTSSFENWEWLDEGTSSQE